MPVSSTPDEVFINCPFDSDYSESFRAIIFAVFACGFRPRTAREIDDASYSRLQKIMDLIGECRLGIHDLSRTELDAASTLPRFNMPFELGLFLAAKEFGDASQKRKRVLVFDVDPYRYQTFISDLNGMDVTAHQGEPALIVAKVRNWLANVTRRRLLSDVAIVADYHGFTSEVPALAAASGFDPQHIPYVDFEFLVTDWLLSAQLGD